MVGRLRNENESLPYPPAMPRHDSCPPMYTSQTHNASRILRGDITEIN